MIGNHEAELLLKAGRDYQIAGPFPSDPTQLMVIVSDDGYRLLAPESVFEPETVTTDVADFTVPTVLPSLNRWQRMHHYQQSAVNHRFAAEVRAYRPREWPIPPPPLVRVHIVRVGRRLLDQDNIVAKPAIDGLKHAGFILDDAPQYIDLTVTQELATRQQLPHTRIHVEIVP